MRLLAPLLLAASSALLSACTIVTAKAPVGTEPVALDAVDWDGTWASGFSAPVTLKTLPDGRLQMIYTSEEDDQLKANELTWTLLSHGDWTFASATDPELQGEYIWARVWREEEQIIAWLPNPRSLTDWVRDGSLPGSIDENGNVHLGALDAEHLDFLTEEEARKAIMWEIPLAFVRISGRTAL